jgi:hypothetical protein
MTYYTAPEGKVYDYAEPHMGKITELDGSESEVQEHLYAKYLALGRFDSIDKYKLVDEPKKSGVRIDVRPTETKSV